ncbi:lipopolysaccharide biosynthesis protein [Actinomycetospora sp. CA-101289]|uniref:lipopolysaccharide biosynthesis protein n=1 Tax=Actinomycetospora sp. CA-101289 TaxID=3239893 RepID=UPI003D976815
MTTTTQERPAPQETATAVEDRDVTRHSVVLSACSAAVGVLSYACTVLMAHLLAPAEYSAYAAAQMLVGIAGIVAGALVPLPLVHTVRAHGAGTETRRQGMAFAVLLTAGAGVLAALVTGVVAAGFAPAPLVVAVAVASAGMFLVAPVLGFLQGELRFRRYVMAMVAQVAGRLGFSVAAVLVGAGAPGAIHGFVAGVVAVLLVAGTATIRRDLTWRPRVLTEKARWAETGDIALVQLVVASVVGSDVVLVAALGSGTPMEAGFQALATLAKAPIYVAGGTVLVTFPLLRGVGRAEAAAILRPALAAFRRIVLPVTAVLATAPAAFVMVVLPARYADALVLLPWLALSGLGFAVLTVLATVLSAAREHRRNRPALALAAVLLMGGLLGGWACGAVTGMAVGGALGALAAAAVMILAARPLLTGTLKATAIEVGAALLATVVLGLLHSHPLAWLLSVVVAGVIVRQKLARSGEGVSEGSA